MNKKGTWFLAASLAAMIVTSGLAMAATTDKDAASAPRQAQVQDKDGLRGHGRPFGGKIDQTELLKLLNIDAQTLHNERAAGKSLLDIAKAHGVSEEKLTDFFVAQMTKRIDEAQQQGRLTVEQAQARKNNLKEQVARMIKDTRQPGYGRPFGGKMDQTELLKLLNIDAQTLHNERAAGKSLLDIAKAHGVSEEKLTNFFVEQMTKRIDEDQKQGRLTAEQAKEMKSNLKERVARMIKDTRQPGRGPGEMTAVLKLLGIDAQTLHSEFQQGKTLVAIAAEHGVSEQQLRDTLKAAVVQRIDEDLKAGRISPADADKIKAKADDRVEKMMTGAGPVKHHDRQGNHDSDKSAEPAE